MAHSGSSSDSYIPDSWVLTSAAQIEYTVIMKVFAILGDAISSDITEFLWSDFMIVSRW